MVYYINRLFFNNKVQALLLLSISFLLTLVLISYDFRDPSFNLATSRFPSNIFSYYGSYISDIFYQFFGVASFFLPICFFIWSIDIYRYGPRRHFAIRLFLLLFTMISLAVTLHGMFESCVLPFYSGGALGRILYQTIIQFNSKIYVVLLILTIVLLILTIEIKLTTYYYVINNMYNLVLKLTEYCLSKCRFKQKENVRATKIQPLSACQDQFRTIESAGELIQKIDIVGTRSKNISSHENVNGEVLSLPPVDLLRSIEAKSYKTETPSELQETAEKLLNVLSDFGVKGQIININCGPVVTLYEFEPSAGTKSSRIIGLSDDIARSLSALSTRIAVIPGRNVLGIELPNKHRVFFSLKELIQTDDYQNGNNLLPLVLGKDLAGKPFIVDLAKMPHLLIAGTTGSGKSVAINTMILSLLYRYTPEECRLIMIDPKMLELSIYDNIPHLLTPVVTEPNKAITALKWVVKEMENRYRLMSTVGVRNIANYNVKIIDGIKSGKALERVLQIGFDPETGKPIYDREAIDMVKLPYIVVIVDEMADLMLVAGKDIELSIQRLAQMARAAGIHIIMATQRPSVDVITGVIKANFPSRISFKVTSKIDSRTILGEQGAEQLLGMGDMLFLGSASKITRVHGPFVDDAEVEAITTYLKSTAVPEYISSVTESTGEDNLSFDSSSSSEGSADADLYKRALQIIQLERKVSISYIQRCLRIGYNRAASLVERMEKDGHISPPNHAGKREIFLPEN